MTICAECKHVLRIIRNQACPTSWYNYQCAAAPRPPAIDPVTGEHGWATRNDLGRDTVSDQKFNYCRDVNTGQCSLFEKREEKVQ